MLEPCSGYVKHADEIKNACGKSRTDGRFWRRYCKEAENTVIEFKAAVQKAEANCRLISDTMLLKVERKRMYDHREFAAQQADHHVKVCYSYLMLHANRNTWYNALSCQYTICKGRALT